MDLTLNRDNNITTGKIYHHVIEKVHHHHLVWCVSPN
jgi:CTP synthase (UTP-ammonia lyase)